MLKEVKEYNQTVKPNSLEIELLKQHFPQYFNKDGEFLISKFEQNLAEDKIDFNKESFGLNFLGKSLARYVSSTKTETYVAPHTEYNAQDLNKDSENAYIIGDNLDALKHLLGSYVGKIKCIYIDPPYNTGSDGFVYNDSFEFTVEKLSNLLDVTEEEAQRIIDLKGKSSHSAWLTFIYPRLVLSRYLLSDDGVIFISIDDNEHANLKEICDEIFGEENFVGCLSRATGTTTGQDANKLGNSLDYCIVYAKTSSFDLGGIPLNEQDQKRFNREDDKGKFSILQLRKTGNEDRKEDRETMFYPIEAPDGSLVYPFGPTNYLSRWRMSVDSYKELLENNMIHWEFEEKPEVSIGEYVKSKWTPYVKYYLEGRTKQISNLLIDIDGNKKASICLKNLFSKKDIFTNPKPIEFLKILLQISQTKNSNVLDFFSGSATTAHAVMQLNAEDGGNRKFIMVQLPEQISEDKPAFKDGYKTIDEIGRKRIELAATKIKAETNADIDYGFKVYSLYQEPNNTISQQEEFNPSLEFKQESIEDFSTEVCSGKDAALTTYMLLDGYGLNTKPEPYKLDTYIAQKVQDTLYILEDGVSSDDLAALIERIEAYQIEINRIVIFHASLDFNQLRELKTNLSCLRHNRHIKLVERY